MHVALASNCFPKNMFSRCVSPWTRVSGARKSSRTTASLRRRMRGLTAAMNSRYSSPNLGAFNLGEKSAGSALNPTKTMALVVRCIRLQGGERAARGSTHQS